jgi:putative endonuclease
MSAARQEFGVLGERIAARWLRRQGWRIVAHRYRSGRRDIDLVARRDGLVAFVEVKARRGSTFGGPVAAVGWRKQRELCRAARTWIDRQSGDIGGATAFRFDVIGVIVVNGAVRIRHVADAFPFNGRA